MMRKLHAAFKDKGVHVLDAPVSGGVIGAQRGTLQVMVGGDEAIYNEVKDVLKAVGDKVGYMGADRRRHDRQARPQHDLASPPAASSPRASRWA